MKNFYVPNYAMDPNSPFARDSENKLVRKNYWYDLQDNSIITLFQTGIGAVLTNEEKKNHLCWDALPNTAFELAPPIR